MRLSVVSGKQGASCLAVVGMLGHAAGYSAALSLHLSLLSTT